MLQDNPANDWDRYEAEQEAIRRHRKRVAAEYDRAEMKGDERRDESMADR